MSDSPPFGRDELVRRGLRLSQLRLIVALEETGQISAAAAQLSISQPAASRLLADTERLFGTPLTLRLARGLGLTEAGLRLASRARDALQQLDAARDEIAALTRGARGRVVIGAVTGPALDLVVPAIRDLRVTWPEIEIAVQVDTSDKLAEALTGRVLDFYIGRLPEGLDARMVTLRQIGPEPISLLVRRDHPLTRRAEPSLAEALDYDWVMQPPGGLQRRTVEAYLLQRGLPLPGRILGTSSLLLTLAIIGETNSIAPVAGAVARFHTASGGAVRILETEAQMEVAPYALVRRRDEPATPQAERVLRLIEQRIDALVAPAPAITSA